jgi:hypothetical protein
MSHFWSRGSSQSSSRTSRSRRCAALALAVARFLPAHCINDSGTGRAAGCSRRRVQAHPCRGSMMNSMLMLVCPKIDFAPPPTAFLPLVATGCCSCCRTRANGQDHWRFRRQRQKENQFCRLSRVSRHIPQESLYASPPMKWSRSKDSSASVAVFPSPTWRLKVTGNLFFFHFLCAKREIF